ncbi:putative holin-like toxin [Paenibacillus agilis]|uniref:Holin-like toxin n=1 Tax=Paenibacillus agilis TaxID=3020863 RepID=A0A559IEL0_9BACL|nr:putative holin-like toxin [Paenibacillus agilis]TVX86086.1 putative holin-like toxin [Paenibacillus agilis]
MSAYEALTLMIAFGTFVVALVALMVSINKRK